MLSGIDSIYLDTICRKCKNLAVEHGGTYLFFLNRIVEKLKEGWSIQYITHCLQENKYLNYEGEDSMTINRYLEEINNSTFSFTPTKIIVNIVDVNVIVPNKVVEVTFADGTKEKSVCREPDVFSLESAISICISKKIMGGSGAYNNAVKRGMKVYEDKLKKEAADKAEQERIVKKREKRLANKQRRAEEKAKSEKERQIEIQKEAYLRAMDVLRSEGCIIAN